MRLDENQAKELINSPKNNPHIKAVKNYESALRVFTEELDEQEIIKEAFWSQLLKKMKNRSVKKFDRTLQFMRFPLPIVQVTDSILNDYFKVFEGKNRYFNFSANREAEALNDWIKVYNPVKWIEDKAKEVLKNKPSAIVVVDRKENGEPYLLNITANRLIDADIKENGELEYIVFMHSVLSENGKVYEKIAVYDDAYYRVYKREKGTDVLIKEVEKSHNLGYCPARVFIGTSSNDKNPFKRRTAFGSSLSKLEDWTIFDVFSNYVDHYVPFPIVERVKNRCGNTRCVNGKVKENVGNGQDKKEVWVNCQVCENKKTGLVGPGTVINIKLQGKKDAEDGSGKFKMHFPDTDKMEYIPKKLDNLELEIRYKTVGVSNVLQKEAVNELQVKGSFASMESILLRNKRELDSLYKWIISTVGNLFYINLTIHVDANFGTEFYLLSEEELQELFKKAKEIGLPREEIKSIYIQLINTKYKGNQEKILRHKMLLDLDNYPFYTEKECIELNAKGVISNSELSLKINFIRFVLQFERENTTITEFGSSLEYDKVIDLIKDELRGYNAKLLEANELPTPPIDPNTPPE